MSSHLQDAVMAVLRTVQDPCSVAAAVPLSIIDMGLLVGTSVDAESNVLVRLRLTSAECLLFPHIVESIVGRVGGISGVRSLEVRVEHDTPWTPGMMSQAARAAVEERRTTAQPSRRVRPRQWKESTRVSRPVGGAVGGVEAG